MRYRIAYLTLAALAVLASCRKHSTDEPSGAAEGPTKVRLGTNIQVNKVTKSLGPLDDWNPAQDVYVYGIAREGENADSSPSVLNFTDPFFMDNVRISAVPAAGNHPEVPHEVMVYKDAAEPFYYLEKHRYEFFGYYVDDAVVSTDPVSGKPSPVKTATRLELPLAIDGGQDIIAAVTNKEADNSAEININRLYSGYSARKGVVPNLVFRHQLSRFNVYLKSGDRYDSTHDENIADKLTLTRIQVESNTQATLVIANKETNGETGVSVGNGLDPATFSDPDWLNVKRGADVHSLTRDDGIHPARSWNLDSFIGSVMVIPGQDKYNFRLGFHQDGYTVEDEVMTSFVLDFNELLPMYSDPKYISDGTHTGTATDAKAEPGHQYDVNIVVYGLQEVRITVSLTPWQEGGSLLADSDPNTGIEALYVDMDDVQVCKDSVVVLNPAILNMTGLAGVEFEYEVADESIASVDMFGNLKGMGLGTTRMLVSARRYAVDDVGNFLFKADGSRFLEAQGEKTVNVIVTEPPILPRNIKISVGGQIVPNGGNVVLNIADGLFFPLSDTHDGPGDLRYFLSSQKGVDGKPADVLTITEGGLAVVADVPQGSPGTVPSASAVLTARMDRYDNPVNGVAYEAVEYVINVTVINLPE